MLQESRQASAEMDVTPAMIDAGMGVARRYVDQEWEANSPDLAAFILTKIYEVMSAARHDSRA